ncbi:MAG: hypothetical protein OEY33_02535 [Bdellovibrionales bacterium]|jgi:hypothetical protein|nr:hypothetical protein [Bdellovibrionales bacterium]
MALFLSLLLSLSVFSEDLDTYMGHQITDIYSSGSYLIYDCKKRSFICVDFLNFENCSKERDFAKKQRYLNMPCAPLKEFKHFQYCKEAQYQLIHNISSRDFCYVDGTLLGN